MSGIAGVWNLDGRPIEPEVLTGMAATLKHRGRDGEARRIVGSIGLAHQHLWVTREEVGESQPLLAPSGVVLAMDGRLDNRDELLETLGLSRTTSDAACVLAAYGAWDEGFAARLNGDFALAIFDPRQRRLALARDAIGIRPLYYVRGPRLFAFASEVKALLAHPDVAARPDDEGIADFVLVSSRPVDQQERTCFVGISAVVPAELVSVTADRFSTRRYWDFDAGRALRLGSLDAYAEAFRERFSEAVRRRIRSAYPVTISVSGGLDSSSIFCQAETLRRAGQADCPTLTGVTYIGREGTPGDEREYVAEIERHYGVQIERIATEALGGLAEDADAQIGAAEAPLIDYMWRLTRELHVRAAARGGRVFASGHWGDQVLFSPAYLVDLFGRFAFGTIRRHLREYARWFGGAEAGVLARRFPVDLIRHHLARPLAGPLKWVRRRVLGVGRPRPWFADAFLRRALRLANRPATLGTGFHSAQARSIYFEARSKYHVHCMEWQNKIAALGGNDAVFPFLDRDLIAFLMAIPGDVQNANGVPRAIAREAMRGVLPERVRARPSKADFSSFVNDGLANDLPVISAALSPECLGVRLGYLDAGQLGPALRHAARGLKGPDCTDSWDLADVFGLEVWLRLFLSGRPN